MDNFIYNLNEFLNECGFTKEMLYDLKWEYWKFL